MTSFVEARSMKSTVLMIFIVNCLGYLFVILLPALATYFKYLKLVFDKHFFYLDYSKVLNS